MFIMQSCHVNAIEEASERCGRVASQRAARHGLERRPHAVFTPRCDIVVAKT